MRYISDDRRRRSGATLVEGAVVLGVLFLLVLAMLDLGILVFRQHVLSSAARHLSREASVHGSRATLLGPWGPNNVGPVAASHTGPIPSAVRPELFGMDPAEVTVTAEWPDGTNEAGSRVRITLTTDHRLVLASVFGSSPRRLVATSTVPISH
jgi:Flp pilus assembly protein TadG